MFNQKNLAIEVECCVDCHLHVWCSRHSEQKYNELYLKVQAKAQEVLKSYSIIKNKVPEHYRQKKSLSKMLGEHKYFDELQHEVVQFPRHGAFEISVNGMLIFSKLKSNLWPCIDKIGSLLQQI